MVGADEFLVTSCSWICWGHVYGHSGRRRGWWIREEKSIVAFIEVCARPSDCRRVAWVDSVSYSFVGIGVAASYPFMTTDRSFVSGICVDLLGSKWELVACIAYRFFWG